MHQPEPIPTAMLSQWLGQTPPFQHCPQIRFGRESNQNLKCTETATKMRNLFYNDLEYNGLFQVIIHVLLSVIYS